MDKCRVCSQNVGLNAQGLPIITGYNKIIAFPRDRCRGKVVVGVGCVHTNGNQGIFVKKSFGQRGNIIAYRRRAVMLDIFLPERFENLICGVENQNVAAVISARFVNDRIKVVKLKKVCLKAGDLFGRRNRKGKCYEYNNERG